MLCAKRDGVKAGNRGPDGSVSGFPSEQTKGPNNIRQYMSYKIAMLQSPAWTCSLSVVWHYTKPSRFYDTESLLRELDRCRELVLEIPISNSNAPHFGINIAVHATVESPRKSPLSARTTSRRATLIREAKRPGWTRNPALRAGNPSRWPKHSAYIRFTTKAATFLWPPFDHVAFSAQAPGLM